MAILGGSPLGLIGVNSSPTRDGMSTFNGGNSRNVNVFLYNNANESKAGTRSLFSGPTSSTISPYGNVGKAGTDDGGGAGMKYQYSGVRKSSLHSNDIYDTSVLNIIEMLSKTRAALRPADFAYLKDIGVYPNNRLMVARRYDTPLGDNIFGKGNVPISILVGWKPQDEDFLNITFGEEWQDSEADFKSVMTSLGEDFMGEKLGSKLGGGLGAIPLPGFTESLQRTVLTKLGVLNDDGSDPLPSGNPNLIKIAKRRKTIGYEEAGSGLKCDVSIKMNVEYEQKFISGIDPTMSWQDILSKIATFGTSRSQTYGLSAKFEQTIQKWVDNPSTIVTDIIKFIKDGLEAAKEKLTEGLNAIVNGSKEGDKGPLGGISVDSIVSGATDAISNISKRQIQKYRIQIEGIARALSGAPSAPWHITLGNPLRPTFCSGDMLMEEVSLTLGPILAFNDLPSSIKVEFTMKNARPWGLQEILAKFNAGHVRVSSVVLTSDSLNPGQSINDKPGEKVGTKNSPITTPLKTDKLSTGVGNQIGGVSKLDTNSVTQLSDVKNNVTGVTTGATTALDNSKSQLNANQFEWSVLVDGRDRASGVATSLADANRSIDTFSTGGTIVDKTIISRAAGSTKEGKVGEAINSDANSTTITSLVLK